MSSLSRPRLPRQRLVAALVAVVAVTATACQRVPQRTYDATRPSPLSATYLTNDPGDQFIVSGSPGWFRASAPSTNRAANTRLLVWPYAQPMAVDQQVCSTWSDQVGPNVQQGLALRVRRDGGRLRAVTIMKNVVWGAQWAFNVITWDTADPTLWRVRGAVSLPAVFYRHPPTIDPLPWRVCARAEGSVVRLKAWRQAEREPAWGDASHGGAIALPPGWTFEGKAGWYVGHLPPGGSAGFTSLTVDRLVTVG